MRRGSIQLNVVFSGITNFSDMLVFVLMILAMRELGTEAFGVFAFAQALAFVHMMFMAFGLNPLMVREVARNKSIAPRYLFNVVLLKAALATVSFLVLSINSFWLMDVSRDAVMATGFLAGAAALRHFSMTARGVFQAFGQFDREALVVGIEQGLLLVVGASILFSGGGVVALAVGFFCSRGIACVITFALVSRSTRLWAAADPALMLGLQREAIPVGLSMLVASLYLHVDTLLLTYMADFSSVGLYNVALKVLTGLMIIASMVVNVWLPQLSHESSKREHNDILVKGVLLLFGLSVVCVIVGVPLSGAAIPIVFGDQYLPATTATQILLFACIFKFQNALLQTLMIATDRRQALLGLSVFGLIARIGLAMIMIPPFGIEGAAAAMLAAELCLFVGGWSFMIRKHFRVQGIRDLMDKLSSVTVKSGS